MLDASEQEVAVFNAARHIAKVLDAGATDVGRPYFVMELVRGVKVTDYCDENNLPTRERLGLFIQVCQAIQHAHQKGIIHRDIKPSNILVTVNDGVAVTHSGRHELLVWNLRLLRQGLAKLGLDWPRPSYPVATEPLPEAVHFRVLTNSSMSVLK